MQTLSQPIPVLSAPYNPLDKRKQFWTLQFFGWSAYFVLVFFAIISPQFNDPDFNLVGQLLNLSAETATGFVLSFFQWCLIKRFVHLPFKSLIAISISSAVLMGIGYNIIKLSCYKVLVYGQAWNHSWDMLEFGGWLMFSLMTMFVWTFVFFLMLYNAQLHQEREKLFQAQSDAHNAQLAMLRYQLNPHFLFNSMNAISTLILKKENHIAFEMLDKLSDFLRHTLEGRQQIHTTLEKELQLLALYSSIEQIRFSSRLHIKKVVDSAANHAIVPTLFLQPILENAIKYAVEPKSGRSTIEIHVRRQANRVHILMKDDGSAQVLTDSGFGIGLDNTKARLERLFNGDYRVTVNRHAPTGTDVWIDIPYKEME